MYPSKIIMLFMNGPLFDHIRFFYRALCYHLLAERYVTLSGINHIGNASQLPKLVAITVIAEKHVKDRRYKDKYFCIVSSSDCAEKYEKDKLLLNLCGCISSTSWLWLKFDTFFLKFVTLSYFQGEVFYLNISTECAL